MNSATPPLLKPRPRYGRWVLLALAVMALPIVIVGIGVASMLTLSRDAAVLRREVMAATDADWDTKVQVSVGRFTLGAVRAGLSFVEAEHMDDALLALSAVRHASVGVYEKSGRGDTWSREQLLAKTDDRMRKRGWTRMVGVTEANEVVLVYASDMADVDDRLDLCIAVVDGNEMVIVSTKVDAGALMKLAERHMPEGGFREKVTLAQLRL